MTDNESALTSICVKQVYEKLQIEHTVTPTFHSTTNGQIERTHSTLIELTRVLAQENNSSPKDEIFNAVRNYNKTIHSVTGEKPEDVFFNRGGHPDIKQKIEANQNKVLTSQQKS
ncbi:Retrovirus-related Pol polyprotein from transposon opus [Eumeta japonica]|uniref:Retrovirus-related Pol polyprotein from transposon opus n=1 Tax=Eumeta variegata TaxID=151549 RepID=A0A4C1TP18_EUMVA|nr:Retrovirus-related Pol polyprotein from transposon opus [Eumeta japonica]